MFKIKEKVIFKMKFNRMKKLGDIKNAIKEFKENKNKNLSYLLEKRFIWMKKFININEKGLEVGSGGGFSKKYILNKNFKISDLAMHKHLDLKNLDGEKTGQKKNSYDFIIAVNMIYHVPFPIKFLDEMHRILKKNGKLIIQEAYCSLIFQVITIIMRHEGFDFTKDVWNEKLPMSDKKNRWSGNIAVPHLLFDNKEKFKERFGKKFLIIHNQLSEFFIFLNSGGVTAKTFYIPLNFFILKILDILDKFLIKFFPNIFAMGRQIVLKKIN